MDSKTLVFQVVSCRRSLKGGGGLSLNLNIGNPMTNPPKSTKVKRDIFDIKFKNLSDGRIYLCETNKFYREGDIQQGRKPSFLEKILSTKKMKDEVSGKTIQLIFI